MTMQVRDIVVYQGQEYRLIDPTRINDFEEEFGFDYIVYSTAGNGCDAPWILGNMTMTNRS